jgi:serine/threonine-protein kinase
MKPMNEPDFDSQTETLAVVLEGLGGRALQATELERLLRIVLRVCDAAALAHRCNMIHCDLEPATIGIGSRGHVQVTDATVVIGCDRVRPDAPANGEHSMLGTAAYMAPEQAWGRHHDLDQRTDVYGIGGILYAILTRTAPHDGGSAIADLALAKSGTVCAPRERCPERSLPPALCRIALRALSANPSDRHPSVELLKHDIEHFLGAHRSEQQVAAA